MDIMNLNGIDFRLIAGIIGMLFAVKRIDQKNFFGPKIYVLAVLISGFMAGAFLVSEKLMLKPMLTQGLIHAGVASILYQTGKLFVPGEDKFFVAKEKADKIKEG